jgi:hypothetical protein
MAQIEQDFLPDDKEEGKGKDQTRFELEKQRMGYMLYLKNEKDGEFSGDIDTLRALEDHNPVTLRERAINSLPLVGKKALPANTIENVKTNVTSVLKERFPEQSDEEIQPKVDGLIEQYKAFIKTSSSEIDESGLDTEAVDKADEEFIDANFQPSIGELTFTRFITKVVRKGGWSERIINKCMERDHLQYHFVRGLSYYQFFKHDTAWVKPVLLKALDNDGAANLFVNWLEGTYTHFENEDWFEPGLLKALENQKAAKLFLKISSRSGFKKQFENREWFSKAIEKAEEIAS